jgi:hypothetical protein
VDSATPTLHPHLTPHTLTVCHISACIPYQRLNEDGSWTIVWQNSHVDNSLNPRWSPTVRCCDSVVCVFKDVTTVTVYVRCCYCGGSVKRFRVVGLRA